LRPDQRHRVLEIQNDPLLDRGKRSRPRADHEGEGAERNDFRENDVTFLERLRAAALYYESLRSEKSVFENKTLAGDDLHNIVEAPGRHDGAFHELPLEVRQVLTVLL